ncbi:MAG: penicillin acylase family protein [Cyclobacteriaceae bacterium]
MKYLGFFFSLSFALIIAVGLAINLANLPPLANIFDPFQGFWQNTRNEEQGEIPDKFLDELNEGVEVVYDEHLIPHIYASNEEDLYRVQGYITAQHRLWQMEFQVMATAGRVSEIAGKAALNLDRRMRRMGMGHGAEANIQFMKENEPETLRFMQVYADGVNAFIDQMSPANLPVEYKLLDYQPEHWSPYKTALFLMNMSESLSGDKDLELTNFRNLFGEEWMDGLFPEVVEGTVPVISKESWDFEPLSPIRPANLIYPDSMLISKVLPAKENGLGSNNWAVSGSKTKNGHPILANDPHLRLNLPSLWFVMQLSTDQNTVKGATLPGALGVIIGFNEHVAWGTTNADRDVKDWYAIHFKNESRSEYLYNKQWIQSTKKLETIKIKNEADFIDTVIYTHYGPVVYDKNFMNGKNPLNFALKWTAHDGSAEQKAFLELNHATNHNEFLKAIEVYTSPAQNFVFASDQGDIAMKVQGKYPLKWEGQGKYLMDGSQPEFEWQGYLPADHNPHEMNPERGFVASANQRPANENYPYYVFGDYFEHYRNRRIVNELSNKESITVEDMMALQNDNYHLMAAEIIPTMVQHLDEGSLNPKGMQLLQELKDWDRIADPEKIGPTVFASWWDNLEMRLLEYWETDDLPVAFPSRHQLSQSIKNDPDAEWFDNYATAVIETVSDLINESFLLMVDELSQIQLENNEINWASYKNTHIYHFIPQFEAFGKDSIQVGGGKNMVNATGAAHGPSWKMIVEMGERPKAFGIYPGGQSGNPGSPYYDNFLDKWANGAYIDINLRPKDDQEGILLKHYFYPNE